MKKKMISLVLALTLLFALALPASAASGAELEAADELYSLGLLRGTGEGFELDENATRQEALTMVIRLLGKEKTALTGAYRHPFSDVSAWADGYVGYGYQKKLVSGYGASRFGGNDPVTAAQYLTFVLRTLGYSDAAGDFRWYSPWALAVKLGLISDQYSRDASTPCTRGAMALISANALKVKLKGGSATLGDYLKNASDDSASALSAREIARRCSGAVFFLETYYDTDSRTEYGTASGFFISADGTAVTNCHALRGVLSARATMVSGETFPVEGIVSADTEHDLAVIKIGKTALSGSTITKFPYLSLGRSALAEEGDTVYAIGSPLRQSNSMTAGIISNTFRCVDGSQPYIQTSAATSIGSSGGPLLNDHGLVIGVNTAKYTDGDDMSLCVPIDRLMTLSKTAPVTTLYDWKQRETGVVRDTECSITSGSYDVTVKAGQSSGVIISTDCVSDFYLGYDTSDGKVAAAQWGTQLSKTSCTLLIFGVSQGTAKITVSFLAGYGNPDAKAEITVHVI